MANNCLEILAISPCPPFSSPPRPRTAHQKKSRMSPQQNGQGRPPQDPPKSAPRLPERIASALPSYFAKLFFSAHHPRAKRVRDESIECTYVNASSQPNHRNPFVRAEQYQTNEAHSLMPVCDVQQDSVSMFICPFIDVNSLLHPLFESN